MASTRGKFETRSPENEKTKKYDRQLRLWGDHGQSFLENARVCLINATATGTEILKGLVLPGIGAFTIVDGNNVTGEDVGRNFFLLKHSIGSNRGSAACQQLLELNPHVRGDYIDESCETLLATNPSYFTTFSVVIATGMPESTVLQLSKLLHVANVPLLLCKSFGQIGYIRLQTPEHTIIESHPDDGFDDLRLTDPFPGLRKHVDSIDLESLSRAEHAHVPYIVILLKALDRWREKHGPTSLPTYSEKKDFESIIESLKFKHHEGDDTPHVEPLNFEEAIKARARTLRKTEIPDNVKKLFEDKECENLNPKSKPFWIMVRALRDFVAVNGTLPLRGSIPDMTSDSDSYVRLAGVYKTEADKHCEDICNRVNEILTALGKPLDIVCEPEIHILCRNSHTLDVLRTRPIFEEYERPKSNLITDSLRNNYQPEEPEIVYYVLLRAVDKFFESFKRYPGCLTHLMETDISKLKSIYSKLVQEWGIGPFPKDDLIHEMCRFGASELHTIASVVGGCAAQEVIKVVTHQYVPINNTFIFNGILCTSTTFDL
ncbi:NEDD8-activating enzyme E1 regulatory subunit [Galendromus occidentalis]|uniref:NEDD8-activating enzyme E1 regulatory subunit n=1 Tax=Galendromus occidentalis TaxID=34638 RepID=A0AAJ7L826_9ACAR|nr:NEDD8-activating enzyme E1 regulatory subunit [Galendromus occidentalis]